LAEAIKAKPHKNSANPKSFFKVTPVVYLNKMKLNLSDHSYMKNMSCDRAYMNQTTLDYLAQGFFGL
jgi:hypothetical protein